MAIEISKLSTKGQIVLPKMIREKMGIESGDNIMFIETDNGEFVIRKISADDKGFLKLAEPSFEFWDNEVDAQYDNL